MPRKKDYAQPSWAERTDLDPKFNIDSPVYEGGPKYEFDNFEDTEENSRLSFIFEKNLEKVADFDENAPKYHWTSIPWANPNGRKLPFGYKRDENNPYLLHPVPEELEALEQAKIYLKKYSFSTVAKWLTAVSGRHIDYNALWKRVKRDKKYDDRALAIRRWAARYKKAILAAEEIEFQLPGAGRGRPYTDEGERSKELHFIPRSSQPRPHPESFDDGTPCEEIKDEGVSRAGPRRPRSSR